MDLKISEPLTLPSGLTVPNRLAKSAMAEGASSNGLPAASLSSGAYAVWADGGWGMKFTGNVMVDERYLGQPGDIALLDNDNDKHDEAKMLAAWKDWARTCKAGGAGATGTGTGTGTGTSPTIVQINHPGRQSPMGAGKRSLWARTLAPSAVPLQLGPGVLAKLVSAVVFGTPRAMTVADIEDVVRRFATMARITAEAGFDGAEIHAAHGYLLAQFLTPQVNRRTDAYGGSAANRAKIVVDIVRAMRAATPKGFTIGIKFNSVDHEAESELQECIEQLHLIVDAGIDFVEISGGSYENPSMFQNRPQAEEKRSARTAAREAFFLDFAKSIRSHFPNTPLMVTGGFRTRQGMEAAVREGGCDMVGLGRPAVLNPSLPKTIVFNPKIKDSDATLYVKNVDIPWIMKMVAPSVGAGAASAWYAKRIGEIKMGSPEHGIDHRGALWR